MIPREAAIARIDGVTNCISVEGDFINEVMLVGPGAGAGPTASAVAGDIAGIARGVIMPPLLRPAGELAPSRKARMRKHEGGYYIRLMVRDRRGAFAAIASRMADHGISLQSIVQKAPPLGHGESGARAMPVVMITHETSEANVRQALADITRDGHVLEGAQMIRIEII